MPSKVWDEIIYPYPNFNCATVEVWEWINNVTPHFINDHVLDIQWNLSITTTLWDTSLPKGHLDELQKAYIVSTSKLVPSVFIKTHYITGNKIYYRGGRYSRQVSLYNPE